MTARTTGGQPDLQMVNPGVDWIPAFEILEARGLEVILVNARYAKNVPGRKSDVSDAGWLRQLHSYGLLRGSFRPEAEIATCAAICASANGLLNMPLPISSTCRRR